MTTVRRVALVVGLYVIGAVLMLPVLEGVRGLLLLPERFIALARWFLVGGLPVAALVAWRYPHLGADGDTPD
ncbi:MAG: hypothetical protein RJQ04_04210 [Longimicrobiales bacterium]